MARVVRITASPRNPATGETVTVRLAGGGDRRGYFYDGQHWRAGLAELPRFKAAIDWSERGWTGRVVPTTGTFTWSPAERAALDELAMIYWPRAAMLIEEGDELSGVFTTHLAGKVADAAVRDGELVITIADLGHDLDQPLLTARFDGSGGGEGGAEAAGRIKRRSWGPVFNVEGRITDKANSIYEFGDPAFPLQGFSALRDMGRSAAPAPTVVTWQGSLAATLAALEASTPAEGSGVVAPSIARAKWWTQPAGPLTADLLGEIGSGYVETAASIAARILAAANGPEVTNISAANGWRAGAAGIHVDEGESAASALDRLLMGVSLLWMLDPAGTVTLRELAFGDPAASLVSDGVARLRTFAPTKSRRVGFRKSYRTHNDGEIAGILLVNRGPWEPDRDYYAGENVEDAGSSWTARLTHTSSAGNRPPTLPTKENEHWRLNAAVGAPGENGANGVDGDSTLNLVSFGSTAVTIAGNTIERVAGTLNYNACVRADPMAGACFISVDIRADNNWTMLAFGEGSTGIEVADQLLTVHYNASIGAFQVYENGDQKASATIGSVAGKMILAYDGVRFRLYIGGEQRGPGWVPSTAPVKLWPKWHAYSAGAYTGLAAGIGSASADETAANQVAVFFPTIPVVQAAYTGAITGGQLPFTMTPTVTRGGSSIRTLASTSYAISNITGGLAGAVTVNNTTGANKGQVAISAGMTGQGTFDYVVTVGGVAQPALRVAILVNKALPPIGGGGGGGNVVTATSFASVNSTSFTTIAELAGVVVGPTGEVDLSAPLMVTIADDTAEGPRPAEMKWQRETSPGTWADVGGVATTAPAPFIQQDGNETSGYFWTNFAGDISAIVTDTGLTPSSTQKYRLAARTVTAFTGQPRYFYGVAAAEGK